MIRFARALSVVVLVAGCNPDPSAHSGASGAAGAGEQSGTFGNPVQTDAGTLTTADGGADDGCTRELRLTAVELGEPPPFDVIIVADHSQSLSWSRDDLAAGLSTLLADVRGRDARFFVLTPTQYGASSAAAIDRISGLELVLWSDAATGAAFMPAMTEYSQVCHDPGGAEIPCPVYERTLSTEYSLDGVWSFVMPDPVAAITATMSDPEILAQQQAISDAILALAGSGSPNEQPLCTLNRYLQQAELPEHAMFIVISDEDDATAPDDCVSAYHFEWGSSENPLGASCTGDDCDVYLYVVQQPALSQSLQFTCVPVDDLGTPHPESGVSQSLNIYGETDSDCTEASPAGPCGPGALAWAMDRCGGGHVIDPCTSSCADTFISGCSLQTTERTPDFCTQSFTHDGASYANMYEYCDASLPGEHAWADCLRYGYTASASQSGTQSVEPLVPGNSTDALITAFQGGLNSRFGAGHAFVEVIGFDPAFECVPEQGQSYATNLRRIATSPRDVFPICGDYSAALERVRELADYLVRSELELTLAPGEAIAAVHVIGNDGAQRTLDPSRYRYDRARRLLVLAEGALTTADATLSVQIQKGCETPVD